MEFGWINGINLAAVFWLIIINVIAYKRGISENFSSRFRIVNILEQLGRYGCMIFMVFPIWVRNWEFGFCSVDAMVVWIISTIILLAVYTILWFWKRRGSTGTLYGLAVVPVLLFLINGILLRHYALIASALLFALCHVMIVRENQN